MELHFTASSGPSAHAFEFAAYRSLETLMGILIWTMGPAAAGS